MRMVPMIDVVFLLLVFFLLTANFRPHEGFLPTELPRQITHAQLSELEPLQIFLHSQPDGSCRIDIDNASSFIIPPASKGGSFQSLSDNIQKILNDQGRNLEDPVKLVPNRDTKWNHVVKAYDALWQLSLKRIIFTMVE